MRERLLSDEARAALRYVRVRGARVDLADFPDFLIIGPQRTGTTWIRANLRDHPDILWPRLKEIFFFSRLKDHGHPKFQSADLEWYLEQFRDPPWMLVVKTTLSLWATGCFYRPRVRGEATASYAAMDGDLIDEVVTLNPRIRAILMIRDPVERAWSHAKKDLVRNRGRRFEEVTEREFAEFFRDPYQLGCARYVESMDSWASRLAENHLLVRTFDEVKTRPAGLLADICSFLGVRSERRFLGHAVDRAVNPTPAEPIPARYSAMLEELLRRDVENLRTRLGLSWPRDSG